MRRISVTAIIIFIVSSLYSQDIRSVNTKVADLLARMPAYNERELVQQMEQMYMMGREGRNLICMRIVDPGTGDDTRERFAIESYSRYLSDYDKVAEAAEWEEECISFIRRLGGLETQAFFFRQLVYIGQKPSSQLASEFLIDEQLCEPALAVISAGRVKGFDRVLAEALSNEGIPCAGGIMNVLADWNPDIAIEDILKWYERGSIDEKGAALRAMGRSTSREALKVLGSAARSADYRWEVTGATSALLEYANTAGERGDLETLKRVSQQVLAASSQAESFQYRATALSLLVKFTGLEAMAYLEEAMLSLDIRYRIAAIRLAQEIPGEHASRKYISIIGKMPPSVQADIITMLGDRGDLVAFDAIVRALFGPDMEVRVAAAMALAKLAGKDAAADLIDYMKSFPYIEDQRAGMSALSIISDENRRILMSQEIESSPDMTKGNLITIIALGGETRYFDQIVQYCNSQHSSLNRSAYYALQYISGPEHTSQLIEMLKNEESGEAIEYLQLAIASSILRSDRTNYSADILIKGLNSATEKSRFIRILPMVGGARALSSLMENFEAGVSEIRELCFEALVSWPDKEVVYQLYNLISSGNKTYESKAFDLYLDRVSGSNFTPEQKLLLLRKVMPLAKTENQKSNVIALASDVKTLQCFMFLSDYLDDPALSQLTARSLIKIATTLPSSSAYFMGADVRTILEKVATLLTPADNDPFIKSLNEFLSKGVGDDGFVSMFNGKDLSGWQGLVENPIVRSKLSSSELAAKQKIADREMAVNWSVKDGAIYFNGEGANLCSVKEYGDFEMLVDWRITKKGDSGIYLRGTPQVQIWDTSRTEVGAEVGSGGLYNNSVNISKPLVVADNPVGDWNTLRIIMTGELVSVWLNGILVVDNVVMENYWDRSIPIFPTGPIELQAHGNELAFRDIFVREISSEDYSLKADEKAQGFVSLFNGRDINNFVGDKESYIVDDGVIVVKPGGSGSGNLYSEKEYGDFNFRFEFQLSPGGNNGLGIRAPLTGDAAYVGMELQILDNTAAIYSNLEPYQYHGSVYGVIPALRGFLNPVGEWNSEEVIVQGTRVTVILNGNIIVDGDIADARDNGTMDHRDHPGLNRATGHIGFLGHGSVVKFRNIRIKEL